MSSSKNRKHMPYADSIANVAHGCTCRRIVNAKATYPKDLRDTCPYHRAAAAQPWNHRIPWNCPTYWDGCNCTGGPYFPTTWVYVSV